MGTRTVSRREGGVELVRATVCCVVPEGSRLECLADEALAWVDESLLPRARACYEADPTPQKRFFFPRFEYALRIGAERAENGVFLVRIAATLTRAQGLELAKSEQVLTVREKDGVIVPKKAAPKGHRREIIARNQ